MIALMSMTAAQVKKLEQLIKTTGWNQNQINGQLEAAKRFAEDSENNKVFVVAANENYIGFAMCQFYAWNRFLQIHGLIVHPDHRHKKIATQLVNEIEIFARKKLARGVYVDTPVNNTAARKFYERIGYKQDYIMTEYYDEGCDGVTYLKLFKT